MKYRAISGFDLKMKDPNDIWYIISASGASFIHVTVKPSCLPLTESISFLQMGLKRCYSVSGHYYCLDITRASMWDSWLLRLWSIISQWEKWDRRSTQHKCWTYGDIFVLVLVLCVASVPFSCAQEMFHNGISFLEETEGKECLSWPVPPVDHS